MAIKTAIVEKQLSPNTHSHPPTAPPLQSGDRLTRYGFERRYRAMPQLKKAELIEGVVFMPSPVSIDHSEPHGQLITWLGVYQAATPEVKFYDNTTVRLDANNEVQPDALLCLETAFGGRCRITADRYLAGAPELIIEIAASSAAYDLHDKMHVYQRNGVQEYLVWQIYEGNLTWFRLTEEGEYLAVTPDKAGLIHSQIFPGLVLNVTALLEKDLARVLADLQQGLAVGDHQAFVERLRDG